MLTSLQARLDSKRILSTPHARREMRAKGLAGIKSLRGHVGCCQHTSLNMPQKIFTVLLCLLLTACTSVQPLPSTVLPTNNATIQPMASPQVLSPIAAPITEPTATTMAIVIPTTAPPSGITYRTDTGLWHVNSDGNSTLLLNISKYTRAVLSSEGTRILYGNNDERSSEDVMVDLSTRRETKLKPSREYVICYTEWWEARPSVILAMVQPISEVGGRVCKGMPAVFSADGTKLNVLGSTPTEYYPFAASPDGRMITFDQGGNPWLYEWEIGVRPFDIAHYRFPQLAEMYFSNPAWSSSGNQLAWVVAGMLDGEWQHGIGIFDLKNRTSRFLYPYEVEGFDGGRSYIEWNSGEEYIAVSNFGKELLWILSVSGTEKYFFEHATNPVWSPDGRWLAYVSQSQKVIVVSPKDKETQELGKGTNIKWSPNGLWLILGNSHWERQSGNWITEVGVWTPQRLDLPQDAFVLDWLGTDAVEKR